MGRTFHIITDQTFNYQNRLLYTIDFINRHPITVRNNLNFVVNSNGNPKTNSIYYSSKKSANAKFYFYAAHALFDENPDSSLFSSYTHHRHKLKYYIPTLCKNLEVQEINKSFDIFEGIFFMISRYEEYFCPPEQIGPTGWMNEEHHFAIKNQLNNIPIVDHLIFLLSDIVNNTATSTKTTYDLSHDVDILARFDNPFKILKSVAASLYYGRGWSQINSDVTHCWQMIVSKKPDPYDSFDFLFRSSKEWTQKHVFVMSGGRTKYDNKYSLNDTKLKEIIQLALSRNYRIGFHPSFDASTNSAQYALEKKNIENYLETIVWSNRQHWLRFDWKVTPQIWQSQNIKSDASMGYNHHLGFRCGTGFPYQMYDFHSESTFKWVEHPFAYMDSALIHESKDKGEDLAKLTKNLLELNKSNTHISFNFHNSNFDPTTPTGQLLTKLYLELMSELEP